MSELQNGLAKGTAYRWLAQFFLCPPNLATLESYRTEDGQAFLAMCKADPALSEVAKMLEDASGSDAGLAQAQARFASAFSQAFDTGKSKSALPYASIYLSERGLLFQQPARDMIKVLTLLQMETPEGVNEPPDHIGIQLHVAAELFSREDKGEAVPISGPAFLQSHMANWLPLFLARCESLPNPEIISTFTRAALKLVQVDEKSAHEGRKVV